MIVKFVRRIVIVVFESVFEGNSAETVGGFAHEIQRIFLIQFNVKRPRSLATTDRASAYLNLL